MGRGGGEGGRGKEGKGQGEGGAEGGRDALHEVTLAEQYAWGHA